MTHACADVPSEPLHVRSRFADAEVSPGDVMTFPDGVPGYESQRHFVLLDIAETAPLKVLHAVNAPDPCFLVTDPRSILPGYRCDLSDADRLRVRAVDDRLLLWLVIVSIREDGHVTVNLRAPIVINPERMIGRQVMPNGCVYPLHHVIERGE